MGAGKSRTRRLAQRQLTFPTSTSSQGFDMRSVLISLLLLLGLQTAWAASPTTAQVDALIKASGMQAQLDQIPSALQSAGEQQSGLAAGFVRPLVTALQQVFQPARMHHILQQDLVQKLDVNTLNDAMRWFSSPEAQSIIAAEQSMLKPEVMDRIAKASKEQKVEGLTVERKDLLTDIDNATQATESALNMMMNMQAAFLSAFSNLITPDRRTEFNTLLQSFAANRAQYREEIQDQLLLQEAVLMQPVPDATLKKYQQFAHSPSGQKLFTALSQALDHTIRTVAQDIPAAVQKLGPGSAPRPVPTKPGESVSD